MLRAAAASVAGRLRRLGVLVVLEAEVLREGAAGAVGIVPWRCRLLALLDREVAAGFQAGVRGCLAAQAAGVPGEAAGQRLAVTLQGGHQAGDLAEVLVHAIAQRRQFAVALGQALAQLLQARRAGVEKVVAQGAEPDAGEQAGDGQNPVDLACRSEERRVGKEWRWR